MSGAICGKGWARRCAASKGSKCRCHCGGENHGTARPRGPQEDKSLHDAADLFQGIREIAILPVGARVITHFDYPGSFGRQATTHLMVFKNGHSYVVVATERPDNPGMSITNAAEALNELLRAEFGEDVIVVEHYPETHGGIGESLSRVTIENGTAKWSPLTRESLTELIVGAHAMAVA